MLQQETGENAALLAEQREKIQATISKKVKEYVYYPGTFEPLALIKGVISDQHVYHYHNDPNGCPTRLTDSNGIIGWAVGYKAWGSISKYKVNRVDNPIRLQGQYEDRETGLHYNRHRYYDRNAGQYITIDPLGLQPNDNLYQFAPNALAWVDPCGLNCWNSFQKALAVARVKLDRTTAARVWDHLRNRSVGRIPRPTVTDPKLQNIVNDLYKGDRMPHVLGHGSTADAARIERISGQMIHGRNHIQKANEYSNALNNWLKRNPGASAGDQGIAKALRDDLQNALTGR